MIVETVTGDIFESDHRHIAFAVNTEGVNDSGFAGTVAQRYWPDLAYVGESKLGDVLSRRCETKTFHALVCHSLGGDGWLPAPGAVKECIDALDIPEDEVVGIVDIGTGPVGIAMGADTAAINGAMLTCDRKLVVYSL